MTQPQTTAAAVEHLQSLGLPRLEAQMLTLHALGRNPQDRAWLLAHGEAPMDAASWIRLDSTVNQRLTGVPMAYLVGHKDFHAITLCVDPRVLDPRDDTETLVEWALAVAPAESELDVLDLGTGSGAIALALARERPRWRIHSSDASADALEVARNNGQTLGLKVEWAQGDWWAAWPNRTFDLVVSNPPYIAENDPHLLALRHEPRSALVSGPDGLRDIRTIAGQAETHLRPGAWLLLEHGHAQAEAVRELLRQAGMTSISSKKDLAGIERCSGGRWAPARFCGA
ncbi:MAG: peptide chain release factor N(5)-glutamine methyltransferase [Alphaproteobacteria bacterium]|nr:peptide chain release factor N(5)-glutamine methyltransferase [Alphaproteobacteria bacterium]